MAVGLRKQGKDGRFNVLFQSSKLFAFREQKKTRVFPRPQANSSPSSSSSLSSSSTCNSSSNSRVSTTRDRNGFKERKLYQSL